MKPLPVPEAGSPHRRGMPPSLLSPSSRSAVPAAADGDHDAAVSEHACVTLSEWWLATAEGDDQKIAVAGTFERNQTVQEYSPAPIAKRHTSSVLETEEGTVLRLHGLHNVLRTYHNGYSATVYSEFLNGFPDWWQSCKPCNPKLMNSHTECCSSNASNSGVDSTQFYLERYMQGRRLDSYGTYLISKFPDILASFLHNDAVFQKSSHLLNGKPRFEEYTCDGDITTNENAAASSEAATGDQRIPEVSLEVRGCRKETQHMSLTDKAAVDEEMPASVYLDMQNSLCLSNGTPILEEYTCDGYIPPNEDAAASNDDNERYIATSKEVNNMEIVLVTGSPSRERGHDDIATDVAVSELVHSTPATGTYRKKTPVASLKSQGSWKENQPIASNKKMKLIDPCLGKQHVGRPKKRISPHAKCQSATRSPGTRNPASYVLWSPLTRDKATSLSMSTPEDLELKRSRSGRVIVPKLDNWCQTIVYGRDGLIAAVIGLDSPALPKWSESKTDRRKKRKTK
ncbi:hypothetical protein BDA96_10G288100 [Sorghum bicolor]|uniref:SANTA domain-containing protein n=1 Tax=Sorghum bicolor TaxID=4558 RepID=A0A921U2I0_SORBI|nr:hypothetical protein BDA96_10G288100 [Sorghum bicolor]